MNAVPAVAVDGAVTEKWVVAPAVTLRVAVAVSPAPLSLAETVLVVSTCAPGALLLTWSIMVQDELAARLLAVTEMDPPGTFRLTLPPEVVIVPQVPPLWATSVTPLGTALLNWTFVNATLVLGLVTVMVRVELPPDAMVDGANPAAMVGVIAVTVMLFDVPLTDCVVSVTVMVCVPLVLRVTEMAPAVSGPFAGRLALASVLLKVKVSEELEMELLN